MCGGRLLILPRVLLNIQSYVSLGTGPYHNTSRVSRVILYVAGDCEGIQCSVVGDIMSLNSKRSHTAEVLTRNAERHINALMFSVIHMYRNVVLV